MNTIRPNSAVRISMGTMLNFEDVLYAESPGVYPVREDSLMLLKEVIPHLKAGKGTYLDMGCGTGLGGLLAAREGWKVIMVDREPRALVLARRNLTLNGSSASLFLSDLFEGITRRWHGRVDLASFNPPYLERIEADGHVREELPLSGPGLAWSLSRRFILESVPFLTARGKVLLLSPIYWDIGMVAEGTCLVEADRKEVGLPSSGEAFNITTFQAAEGQDVK